MDIKSLLMAVVWDRVHQTGFRAFTHEAMKSLWRINTLK